VKKRSNNRIGWAFLSPSLAILGFVGILPFLFVIFIGFFSWNVFSAERCRQFVGFENYQLLVFYPMFLSAMGRSILFTVLVVGL
jgi:multiple sugar transport system permease protein